jgi:plasmid stabilization system protein ParE
LKVEFAPLAKEQLRLAQAIHEAESRARAKRFAAEVRRATRLLKDHPEAAPRIRNFRRLVLARVPYSMLYAVAEDRVYIMELVHQKQEPDYWADKDDS